MDKRKKERLRRALRALLVFFAVLLFVVSLVIPVINNFIAAGVVDDLEALPLPEGTTIVETCSAAGDLTGRGSGMQYLGAVLLHSERSIEELNHHYIPYRHGLFDCLVDVQSTSAITQVKEQKLAFSTEITGDGWYILYTWHQVPNWAADWLNLDNRGR